MSLLDTIATILRLVVFSCQTVETVTLNSIVLVVLRGDYRILSTLEENTVLLTNSVPAKFIAQLFLFKSR